MIKQLPSINPNTNLATSYHFKPASAIKLVSSPVTLSWRIKRKIITDLFCHTGRMQKFFKVDEIGKPENGRTITKRRRRSKMAALKQNGVAETKWQHLHKMAALEQNGVKVALLRQNGST